MARTRMLEVVGTPEHIFAALVRGGGGRGTELFEALQNSLALFFRTGMMVFSVTFLEVVLGAGLGP
jgi:hypothetical protein